VVVAIAGVLFALVLTCFVFRVLFIVLVLDLFDLGCQR
jgi:hypothetical protein